MNPAYGDSMVDRDVAHLEQTDTRNRHSKQLSVIRLSDQMLEDMIANC